MINSSAAVWARQTPRFIYERIYCARGDIENRIKELHGGACTRRAAPRSSCWRC